MVDFSYRLPSAIDAVYAAPPPQQFKTTPPGILPGNTELIPVQATARVTALLPLATA